MNLNNASMLWSINEQLERDNEDETLAYYIPCDEAIKLDATQYTTAEIDSGAVTSATVASEKNLCK